MIGTGIGFGIHETAISGPEVATLASRLAGVAHSRAGARHLMTHPDVARIAGDPRLVSIASRWLGGEALPFKATLFDKSPDANWLVAWHQDTALPLRHRRDVPGWGPWSVKAGVIYAKAPASALEGVIALRLHLDDSAATNGPLRVLPGSHCDGVLDHEAIQRLYETVRAKACLVGRGGVIAMRPLLVHASTKSTSDESRRVLHIEYALSLHPGAGLELHVA